MLSISQRKAKYLTITDTSLILKAMENGLTPLECRVWQYLNACLAHEINIVDVETAEYLNLSLNMFYDIAETLVERNLIPEPFIYLGENGNV